MIYLLFSIIFSSSLYLIFSFQKKYDVDVNVSLVVNYLVASIFGGLFYREEITHIDIVDSNWLLLALIMGLAFFTSFRIMSLTTRHTSIKVAAVASKMSMVIPAAFAIIVFKEGLNVLKIIGICLGIIAVYLTAKPNKHTSTKSWLPLFLFIGCGIVDVLINYSEHLYGETIGMEVFIPCVFGCAALVGFAYLIISKRFSQISLATLLWGAILGVFNFFSLVFLYLTLETSPVESAVIFPINNIGVVLVSTLLGTLVFNQKVNRIGLLGILLACISLVFLAQ